MNAHSPSCSRGGLGIGLAGIFERRLRGRPPLLLTEPRGQQLLILCDIGGSLKEQPFETYSFLVLDLDRNRLWLQGQSAFRRKEIGRASCREGGCKYV